MDWSDYEFILDSLEREPQRTGELTGWETVIFELDEELPAPVEE